jgi:hypothetical protein
MVQTTRLIRTGSTGSHATAVSAGMDLGALNAFNALNDVSLAQARELAGRPAAYIEGGIDPIAARDAERPKSRSATLSRHTLQRSVRCSQTPLKRATALDIGVDVKRIWRWLHGQGRPTTNDILRLLEAVMRRVDAISKARNGVIMSYQVAAAAMRQPPASAASCQVGYRTRADLSARRF